MNKMYKYFSLWLCVLMTISVMCIAEATDTQINLSEKDYQVAERLNAIGIIPHVSEKEMMKTPTRSEVAELMVRFVNLPVTSDESVVSPFIDVAPTAENFDAIHALYKMGYISRGEDLKFYPDQVVSANEAVTFVVKAMGYKAFAEANGGYPTGYFYVASRYDLLKDVKINGAEPVYMYELYHMINKALDAPALEYVGYVDGSDRYNIDKTYTIMAKYWNGYQKSGVVTGNSVSCLNKPESNIGSDQIRIDDTIYNLATEVSGELLGKAVTFFALEVADDHDTLIYVEENTKKNTTSVLDYTDVVPGKCTNSVIVYQDPETEKEKKFDLETNCNVIYNGVCWTGYHNIKEVFPAYGYIELVDHNANDVVDVIKVYDYKNMVVSYVDTHDEVIYEKNANGNDLFYGGEISFHLMDAETRDVVSVNKLSYDDVITFAKSKNGEYVEAYVSRKTVEGQITSVTTLNGLDIYTIDGTDYKAAVDGVANIPLGTQGVFKLDYFGNILEIAYNTEENGEYTSGILMGLYDSGNGITAPAKLKFYNVNGDMSEYYTQEKVLIDNERMDMHLATVKEQIVSYTGQLVRYKLRDGKVSEIDTAFVPDKDAGQTTADRLGTLTAIASGTQIQRRSYVYRMSSDYNFYVHGNATLIVVPSDPMDEENYVLTTPTEFLKNGHTYTATGTSGTYTNVLPNLKVQVYNLGTPENKNEIGTTIVMQCDPITAWSQGGNFRVVTKITTVFDEELQQEATRLYFDGNDNTYHTVADTIRFVNNSNKTHFSQTNLKVGDVVTFGLDHENIIRTLQIWYRMDCTNVSDVTLREGKWANSTNFDAQPLRAAATVTAVDPTKKIISYTTLDGEKNWMMSYSSPTIWLVRSDVERTGTLETITPSGLKPGDRIVFSASLASCTHIVVYR